MSINWKDVTLRTEQIKDKFCTSYFSLKQKYPSRKQTDARFAIFIKCKNVIRAIDLGAVLVRDHAQNHNWWSQFGDITNQETKIIIGETLDSFNKILRFSFVMFFFSMIESSFRAFVRTMDSSACNNAKDNFKNIYSWLLSPRHITLSNNEYEKLLDILRIYRNSFHSNGVFLPETPGDQTFTYKNKSYIFEDGKNIHFDTWNHYFDLVEDAHDMIFKIVEAEEVSSLPDIPSFEA